MNRTVTVKGTGDIRVEPDLTVVTMRLESHDMEYEKAMDKAQKAIEAVSIAIMSAGFKKKDLKTTNFQVTTKYENYRDADNNYKNRFDGYICEHSLKLTFPLNMKKLSSVLNAISASNRNPQLDIQFSIKNMQAVNELLLQDATINARRKAEILAEASSHALGKLLSIEYNRNDISYISPTRLGVQNRAMAFDMTPEDISISDNVTFVWELK